MEQRAHSLLFITALGALPCALSNPVGRLVALTDGVVMVSTDRVVLSELAC
jgi:hypothetical protein